MMYAEWVSEHMMGPKQRLAGDLLPRRNLRQRLTPPRLTVRGIDNCRQFAEKALPIIVRFFGPIQKGRDNPQLSEVLNPSCIR